MMKPSLRPTARNGGLLTSTAMAVALIALPMMPATAQEADEGYDLGTLVLSGTKRNERIEDYTGSVYVVSSESLKENGINDAQDAVRDTPGANFYSYADRVNSYTTIRGVGPMLQPLSPDDSSVLTFVDGAPLMLEQSASSYLDLAQVEIFKGPQNTTFGRATSGGAINLVPNLPSDENEGRVRLEFGTDNEYLAEFIGNVALKPGELAARIALRKTGRDAYLVNTAGPDFGQDEMTAGRLSLLYTPADATSVLFTYAGEEYDLTPPYYIGQPGDGDLLPAAQSFAMDKGESHQFTLKFEQEFERFAFTSQTSYNTLDVTTRYQGDHNLWSLTFGAPAEFFANEETNRIRWDKDQTRLTQEFRLSSLPGDRISWVAGVMAYQDENDITGDNHVAVFQGAQSGLKDFHQTNEAIAIFGDATVPLSEKLSFSGGLRLAREVKEFNSTYNANGLDALYPGVLPTFAESGRKTYEYWTGKLALSYDWTSDASTYASVSKGYKSGGFGVFNSFMAYGVPRDTYEPTKTVSYEIGGRASLLNGALDLSGALFHIDMSDEQIMLFEFASFQTENANVDATSTGFEVEADWYMGNNWQLRTGVAYTDTEITGLPANASALNPGLEVGDQLPNTPEWAFNVGLGYRASSAELGWTSPNAPAEISARVNYQFLGDQYFDAANNGKIDARGLLSARVGLHWYNSELYIFGENLTDEDYFSTRQPLGTVFGTTETAYGTTPGVGRTIGVGFSTSF